MGAERPVLGLASSPVVATATSCLLECATGGPLARGDMGVARVEDIGQVFMV
jgi:hypothetical protein